MQLLKPLVEIGVARLIGRCLDNHAEYKPDWQSKSDAKCNVFKQQIADDDPDNHADNQPCLGA